MTPSLLEERRVAPPERNRPPKAARRRISRREGRVAYFFVAPLMLGIALFQLYPMGITIYVSLTEWDGLSQPTFVGLANYVRLLTAEPVFLQTVRNTFLFMLAAIPLTMVLALGLAAMTKEARRGMTVLRLAFFVPFVSSQVAISVVWLGLFSGQHSIVNKGLGLIGITGPDWLVEAPWPLLTIVIASVWQGAGYPMVVLIAGMQAIPESLYEAASLDGASRFRRFRSITIPLLTPSLFFVSIQQFIVSFQVFAVVLVMTGGGPGNDTNVYMLNLYNTAFRDGQLGHASAMAWILFVVLGAMTVIQWRLQRRWVFYE